MMQPSYDWLASGEGETIWSLVLTIGKIHPLTAKESVGSGDRLIVVIPGNPGHCRFYETFATHLVDHDPNTTVWVLSHVGHVQVPPELKSRLGYTFAFKSNYLASQVKHKLDFLLKYVPRKRTRLTLVGHSIGSYMIMEVLDALGQNGITVDAAALLFPTLERMAETTNGKAMLVMRKLGLNRVLDTILPPIASLLPSDLKMNLVNRRCQRHKNSTGTCLPADQNVIQAAVDLCHGDVIRQALEMAYDEFENVRGLNETVFNHHWKKLFLVYAMKDGWCPLTFRNDLIKKWPNVKNIVVENEQVEHAFVIFDNKIVSDLVSSHLMRPNDG